MAKKDKKQSEKHDEELDEERADDERDEDEEEDEAVSAKPVASARTGRAQARARRAVAKTDDHADDHGHGHDHDDDEEDAYDGEDPYWWTPYSVMAALVLVGILGFVGVFNKVLGGIAAHPAAPVESAAPSAMADAKPPTPPQPRPGAQPGQPGQPGQRPPPGEMLGAKHLLVMYKGSRRAPPTISRTQDEAKARAAEAMKKAKSAPTKFEDIVKEYSDDPTAANNKGDLGKFPKGSMVPEFQTALEKIKVGEVSEVVETPFGYHVILRTQ